MIKRIRGRHARAVALTLLGPGMVLLAIPALATGAIVLLLGVGFGAAALATGGAVTIAIGAGLIPVGLMVGKAGKSRLDKGVVSQLFPSNDIEAAVARHNDQLRARLGLPPMIRIDDFLDVVGNPGGPRLQGTDPADELVLAMLAQLVFADREFSDAEITLCERLFPESSPQDALAAVRHARAQPVDAVALLSAIPAREDQRKLVQFAQKVATVDDVYHADEHDYIAHLRASIQPAPSDKE